MSGITITAGTWARVRLRDDCPGDQRRPHHPAEDGMRVVVTAVGKDGDHAMLALCKGDGRSCQRLRLRGV